MRLIREQSILSMPLPEQPWDKTTMDLCEYQHNYVVVSNYYSRLIEILHLINNHHTSHPQAAACVHDRQWTPVFQCRVQEVGKAAGIQTLHTQPSLPTNRHAERSPAELIMERIVALQKRNTEAKEKVF